MRSRRSLMPIGASSSIRSPSQMAPPCGASASPSRLTHSDLARGGSFFSRRERKRSSGDGVLAMCGRRPGGYEDS
ncbi:Uncharacterised protein [Bordetella pertussis]|nr:Uncharacterised protein [Bordetella pertussis]